MSVARTGRAVVNIRFLLLSLVRYGATTERFLVDVQSVRWEETRLTRDVTLDAGARARVFPRVTDHTGTIRRSVQEM